jgi:uncharacterized surface anchored protein
MKGVEFTIEPTGDTAKLPDVTTQKVTTGTSGTFAFKNIPLGTFKITETKTPAGFKEIEPLEISFVWNNMKSISSPLSV